MEIHDIVAVMLSPAMAHVHMLNQLFLADEIAALAALASAFAARSRLPRLRANWYFINLGKCVTRFVDVSSIRQRRCLQSFLKAAGGWYTSPGS